MVTFKTITYTVHSQFHLHSNTHFNLITLTIYFTSLCQSQSLLCTSCFSTSFSFHNLQNSLRLFITNNRYTYYKRAWHLHQSNASLDCKMCGDSTTVVFVSAKIPFKINSFSKQLELYELICLLNNERPCTSTCLHMHVLMWFVSSILLQLSNWMTLIVH